MSVEWVSSDSKYEISSKNHLLQLMSNGTLFSDTGNPPSDYLSSDYIQVVSIDLESDSNFEFHHKGPEHGRQLDPVGSESLWFPGG